MSEELTQAGKKVLDLDSVIRTETVFSRLPFHNLSKKETLELFIAKEKPGADDGTGTGTAQVRNRTERELEKYELYWKVSPNPEYGEPRQLAYDIDTLVVAKRLDEIGRPLPAWIELGSLRSIAHEVGNKPDTAAIKRALLQNSSAYIKFKIAYKDQAGNRQTQTDYAIRYTVRFRGTSRPDGSKFENVYISFTAPFAQILNTTKQRPLDYGYLRVLPPMARRWYELISYLFWAAFKNQQPYAEMRYSEYCKLAPQKRLMDRHKAQTQMGKIARPHLKSGYLAKVEYCSTTDPEGNRDWVIRYYPGPAAREEFDAFNGNLLKAPQQRSELRVVPSPQRASQPPSNVRIEAKATAPVRVPISTVTPSGPIEDLMRYWRERKGFPVDGPIPPRDQETCRSILEQCGQDLTAAKAAVDLALTEKPDAANIAFVTYNSYPQRAVATRGADDARKARAEETRRAQEELEREKQVVIQQAKSAFDALPAEEREQLVAEARKKIRPFIERAPDQWPAERILETALHGYVSGVLDTWARGRFSRATQAPTLTPNQ